ncbi:MFS transporter [Nocardioides sp.]|uniref:MFS transporter n=1 Tax=Nocardioides sp. TaxID=35761 RepID=UPI002ED5548B
MSGPDLRRVVAVLGLSQIVSWGCLYYGFAALQSSITADTGWSATSVTAAFSLALVVSAGVGVWVGRHLDSHGPRLVMIGATVLAVPGMVTIAAAPSLPWFYAGWMLVGAAMAGTLYPPAFAALTRWGGQDRVRALTAVTLAGGLASTVFAPLAAAVDAAAGWRTAYLVLTSVAVGVTLPLHWWGLRHRWTRPAASIPAASSRHDTTATRVATTRPFVALALANALVALAAFAVVVNMVPMLREQGMSTQTAALVLGLGGVGQVIGRIGYARLAASAGVTTRGVVVAAAVAVFTAAFAVAPPVAWMVITLGMLLGLARGLHTLVHATAVTDRWGPTSYGRLNGILTAPALATSAAAPFAGALLASATGSYGAAFLVLAAVAAAGAVLMVAATPPFRPDPT